MNFKNLDLKSAMVGALAVIIVMALVLLGIRVFDGCSNENSEPPLYEQVSEALEAHMDDSPSNDMPEQIEEITRPSDFDTDLSDYERKDGKILNGDYFLTLMTRLGAPQNVIYELEHKSEGVFDMRHLKVGYPYQAYYTKGEPSELAYLIYEQDSRSYVVFSLIDSIDVSICQKKIQTQVEYIELEISSSLWSDIISQGGPGLLAIRLSDIYAWSIDFFGLQKGDSFKAVYQVSTHNGSILGVDKVLYAEFLHGNDTYQAYYYDDGSGNYYWNEKGESMRKAFLKAPLSYTRISSGFSYSRRHPVTRKVRPHTGIDYAAPAGTEVMSIGDGVVVYKGYKTQEGNMVKIKHNSVYTSAYLHLSKYAKNLKVGDRVSQGQVIGYVGSTGYSTGPHLDFRIWKNGTPINPLKMDSPPAEPISEDKKEDFQRSQQESRRAALTFQARTILKQTVEIIKTR